MKIINHEVRTYTFDEIEIEGRTDDFRYFRKNKIECKYDWEYFDSFEQAWMTVHDAETYDKLDELFSDYEYITMINLGLPEHLKVKI